MVHSQTASESRALETSSFYKECLKIHHLIINFDPDYQLPPTQNGLFYLAKKLRFRLEDEDIIQKIEFDHQISLIQRFLKTLSKFE